MSSIVGKATSMREVLLEFAELRARLEEAEATIEAIRSGSVDALVVRSEHGDQVFTLKGADEPYRIFVENMQDGAVTLDDSATILYCNRAFAQLIGEPLERVIGTNLQKYLFSSEVVQRLLGGGEDSRIETEMVREHGTVSVLLAVTPVDLEGPAALAVTVTNLTAQKAHERQLRKANAELEGFCYSVSHDMRAPLRSMISAAGIVIEDYGSLLPQQAIGELKRIAGSANHLGRLMDDLLAYARLSRTTVTAVDIDLTSMANRVAESVSQGIDANATWKIQPDLNAYGDPRLLELALQNIFSNALKFSAKSDRPEIVVGWDREKSAFYVSDNGIGFDMQYVDKLFQPFERLHRQHEYPGTGIGLANVKRIIAQHGGEVWAVGEPSKGATFYFTLPEEY